MAIGSRNQGEGIFIEFNRVTMNEWLTNSRVAERSKKYESCYEEYCKQKGWENFKSRNGEYVLIHTLSHMLIKEMAIRQVTLHPLYMKESIVVTKCAGIFDLYRSRR